MSSSPGYIELQRATFHAKFRDTQEPMFNLIWDAVENWKDVVIEIEEVSPTVMSHQLQTSDFPHIVIIITEELSVAWEVCKGADNESK